MIVRFADNFEDAEEVAGLLKELQDALNDYKVCSHGRAPSIYSRRFG